jgi:transposase-like protein
MLEEEIKKLTAAIYELNATLEAQGAPTVSAPVHSGKSVKDVVEEAVGKPSKVDRETRNGVTAPKPGGQVAKAWVIFDDLTNELGEPVKFPDAQSACGKAGIKENTARNAHSQWRKFYSSEEPETEEVEEASLLEVSLIDLDTKEVEEVEEVEETETAFSHEDVKKMALAISRADRSKRDWMKNTLAEYGASIATDLSPEETQIVGKLFADMKKEVGA